MEALKVETEYIGQNNDIILVKLQGHVDQSNSDKLEQLIEQILADKKSKIVVDMKELTYMSSAGWGKFIGEIKRIREQGGDLKLARLTPEVYEIFNILEFYHILDEYPTIEDAVSEFDQTPRPSRTPDEELLRELDNVNEEENQEAPQIPENGISFLPPEDFISQEFEEPSEDNYGSGEEIEIPLSESAVDFDAKDVQFRDIGSEFPESNLKELPVVEKIKRVVMTYPLLGSWGIRKMLRHDEFGAEKVNVFKIWRILRKLDLNSKYKRYRFFRSY